VAYDITEERSYDSDQGAVFQAALGAIGGLEGKVLKQDAAAGLIEAKFDKKILGKVLGDRTQFEIHVSGSGDKTTVNATGYPLDPVGRKLMFGARKGVTKTVMGWFWAHLEHRL